VSQCTICAFLDITPKTIQNWRKNGWTDLRKGSARYVAHRLSPEEEQAFYDAANTPRLREKTPEQIVAMLAEEGSYLGSVSTLYRILRKRKALGHRQEWSRKFSHRNTQRSEIRDRHTEAIPVIASPGDVKCDVAPSRGYFVNDGVFSMGMRRIPVA